MRQQYLTLRPISIFISRNDFEATQSLRRSAADQ
jgi:hypothetical protein